MKTPVCPIIHNKQPHILKILILLIRYSPLHLIYNECFKTNIIFKAFKRKVIIINDLQNANKILHDKENNFPKSGFVNKLLKPLLHDSIFNTNGKKWERSRSILKPIFGELKIIKTFSTMQDATIELVSRILDQDLPKLLDIEYEISYVTADIILRTILSTKLTPEKAFKTIHAFNGYQVTQAKSMFLGIFGLTRSKKKLWEKGNAIREVLKEIIEPRYINYQKNGYDIKNDILTQLLKAKDPTTNETLSLDEVVSHVTMLFLAGHETSASTLSWALYLIAFKQDIQQELYEEITSICVEKKDIDFEMLKKLTKVKNVILETLRLYPPVYILPREVYCESILAGQNIKPKEHLIGISPWLIHRNPDNWDEPHNFSPHRFNIINDRLKLKEGKFIPFSKGKRACIGEAFAMQEAILILSYLVRNFNFSIRPGWSPIPVARVTLRSKNGIKLILKKRK